MRWGGVDVTAITPPSDRASPHSWVVRSSEALASPGSTHKVAAVSWSCKQCGSVVETFLDHSRGSQAIAAWLNIVRHPGIPSRCDLALAERVMQS